MFNVNSAQGNQVQLESLDSLKATNPNTMGLESLDALRNNNSGSLQTLDSVRTNNYMDPNMSIPQGDILAPLDAINPALPDEPSKEDTKERGVTGFVGGLFKGFGKAGIDTVMGVVTLGKVVVGGIVHPKQTLNWVGGGIKYAVNHPIKAAKTVAIDLPVGIVNGIVDPYKQSIKQGKYGEAVGRGVFDVGIILLTAGLGGEGEAAAKTGTGAAEVAGDAAKTTTTVVDAAADVTKVADGVADGAKVVTTGVQGGIKIGSNGIKIGNVTGNVVINIGNTTSNVTQNIGRVTKAASTAAGTTEAVAATTEAIVNGTKIAAGLSDLGGTLSKGASRLLNMLKPIGTGIESGLTSIVGPNAAAVIRSTTVAIGHGISTGATAVKNGALFVKAHPIATGLIAGKTVDVIQKGLEASDQIGPGN